MPPSKGRIERKVKPKVRRIITHGDDLDAVGNEINGFSYNDSSSSSDGSLPPTRTILGKESDSEDSENSTGQPTSATDPRQEEEYSDSDDVCEVLRPGDVIKDDDAGTGVDGTGDDNLETVLTQTQDPGLAVKSRKVLLQTNVPGSSSLSGKRKNKASTKRKCLPEASDSTAKKTRVSSKDNVTQGHSDLVDPSVRKDQLHPVATRFHSMATTSWLWVLMLHTQLSLQWSN